MSYYDVENPTVIDSLWNDGNGKYFDYYVRIGYEDCDDETVEELLDELERFADFGNNCHVVDETDDEYILFTGLMTREDVEDLNELLDGFPGIKVW